MRVSIIMLIFSLLFSNSFESFHKKFIINNSYTIDPYNNNRVTSEAQGYTLYLCVKYNKKELFNSIWNWTKKNLQRKDNLFAWAYKNKILDNNNAVDGDLFIAYALYLAYKRWGDSYYFYEFKKILKSITEMFLPILWNGDLDILLIPAKFGFFKENVLTIFPSYYIPFIFRDFEEFNSLYEKAYKYSYTIFSSTNLTTNIYYDLIEKGFLRGKYMDLDVYRIIWYSYLDGEDVSKFKNTFLLANKFFQKNHFLPLKLYLDGKYVGNSPYCVYKWFYLVYKDEKYLNKYEELKRFDKKNYFCEALDLMKGN